MGRSRSRSPRRKERRRSRSKDRGERGADRGGTTGGTGGIDKYGRDVRDIGKSEKRSTREEPRSTTREETRSSREETRYSREETRSKDFPPPPETRPKNSDYYASSREYSSKDPYTSSSSTGAYETTNGEISYDKYAPPPLPVTNGNVYDSRGGYFDNYQEKPPPKPKETEEDSEIRKMQQLMGFGGFESSKGKHKEGNSGAYAKINQPRKFRQYMNRRGGFNRPLDWVA